MKKVFWQGASSAAISFALAAIAVSSVVTQQWGILVFSVCPLAISILRMLYFREVAIGLDVKRLLTPNIWEHDQGRILVRPATVVQCPDTGETVAWFGVNVSREEVELWLLENGWKHTVKGWTKCING